MRDKLRVTSQMQRNRHNPQSAIRKCNRLRADWFAISLKRNIFAYCCSIHFGRKMSFNIFANFYCSKMCVLNRSEGSFGFWLFIFIEDLYVWLFKSIDNNKLQQCKKVNRRKILLSNTIQNTYFAWVENIASICYGKYWSNMENSDTAIFHIAHLAYSYCTYYSDHLLF